MRIAIWIVAAVFFFGVLPLGAAPLCGELLCLTDLSGDEARAIAELVAEARVDFPSAFDGVASVCERVPDMDARKHGRLALVGPPLGSMGNGAVPAIIDRLVLTPSESEAWTASARTAWRIGLVDALGRFRDPRAEMVLGAICRSSDISPKVLEAASAALGRLETDTAASTLLKLSSQPGERGVAVLAGMGHCRRSDIAARLAEALPEQRNPVDHRRVARALATVASGPIWRAGMTEHPDEGPVVRQLATQALFEAWLTRSEAERPGLVTAMLVVDDPSLSGLIALRREGADPGLARALHDLERRLASSPVSRMKVPRG